MDKEGYPVFKGLQKPLEFMGIRGRFLTLAAAAIGVSFVGFIVFSIALGKIAGFIAMLVMAVAGLVVIYVKQRGGLHNKRQCERNLCLQKTESELLKPVILWHTPEKEYLTDFTHSWKRRTAMSSSSRPAGIRPSSSG